MKKTGMTFMLLALACGPLYAGQDVQAPGFLSGWWAGINGFEKMYWFMAVPASLLFIVNLILTFAGLGGDGADGDIDGDFDADGHEAGDGASGASFPVFSVRNFIIFFMMSGWSGIAMVWSHAGVGATVAVSFIIGLLMMLLVAFLFFMIGRLVHSGNVSIRQAVGAVGTVYLTVPAGKGGTGKVNVLVQNEKIEYKAMTDGDALPTGTPVRVAGLVGRDILLVEKN